MAASASGDSAIGSSIAGFVASYVARVHCHPNVRTAAPRPANTAARAMWARVGTQIASAG